MLPTKSLTSREEKNVPGTKTDKQRITVLACSYAAGTHCMHLMCIGKSKKPRALKDISENALPVYYRAQKSAWKSADLFTEWFNNDNDGKEEEIVHILLENIPGCENIEEREISEWINSDTSELHFTEQDIVDMVLQKEERRKSETNDEDDVAENSHVTANDTFNALEVALQFVEQCNEAKPSDVLLMKEWLDIVARKRCDKKVQMNISQFFFKK
ncbi:hypothetical protein PR048_012405 [Dryococelus australis]|uniref:DDE-1 domain-containing protein n=1 Tax=Dryococelus australis TaxID=614101 RepID=A0ABQ9HPG2_9NEOP|nr:hypothetical protein PR048_012405 [Dryococelus australis]